MNDKPKIIVSLTSFPAAIPYAVEAIRSVLGGTLLPDKLVLYLDTNKFPGGYLLNLKHLKLKTRFSKCGLIQLKYVRTRS